ncbi:ABC transporter permease [Candidatus Woesearchaeota archaeon]|nr:ABC transporter permease [Candidatus Woesearchaeota archaeon]
MESELRRDLRILKYLTLTDFKLKYNRNILGFFWSLLKPLLMLLTLYVVFHLVIKLDVPHYELFLLLGIILWGFFTEATSYSMSAMTRSTSLIKKAIFKKSLLVVSINLSSLITLLLNLIIFSIFLFASGVGFTWLALLFLLLVAELFTFTLGVSFILSSLYVKFRDLSHIWDVLTQIGFWITPIIYPISLIPREYHNLYILNPLTRIIEDSRNMLIMQALPALDFSYAKHVYITLFICLGALILGLWLFDKRSGKFAEQV